MIWGIFPAGRENSNGGFDPSQYSLGPLLGENKLYSYVVHHDKRQHTFKHIGRPNTSVWGTASAAKELKFCRHAKEREKWN